MSQPKTEHTLFILLISSLVRSPLFCVTAEIQASLFKFTGQAALHFPQLIQCFISLLLLKLISVKIEPINTKLPYFSVIKSPFSPITPRPAKAAAFTSKIGE